METEGLEVYILPPQNNQIGKMLAVNNSSNKSAGLNLCQLQDDLLVYNESH